MNAPDCHSLCDAVRGGEDVDVVDERAPAELPVLVQQCRHERELVDGSNLEVGRILGRKGTIPLSVRDEVKC